MIFRAGRDNPIACEAAARWIVLCPTGECSAFEVVPNAIIERQILSNLPSILNVQAVDIVGRLDESRSYGNRKRRRSRGRSETLPLAKVKLLKERIVREMADVETGFDRMRRMGPGKIVDPLIPILDATLRTAESGAVVENGSRLPRKRRKFQKGIEISVAEKRSQVHRIEVYVATV